MAVSGKIKLQGFKELDKGLEEFKKATARNILKRAALNAAIPLQEHMRILAPHRLGLLRSSIASSASPKLRFDPGKIAYSQVLRGGGSKAAAVQAMRAARRGNTDNALKVDVVVGVLAEVFYAHFVEYGTSRAPAHPFMRPAFDQKVESVLEHIASALRAELDKARERAARKAAKAAQAAR